MRSLVVLYAVSASLSSLLGQPAVNAIPPDPAMTRISLVGPNNNQFQTAVARLIPAESMPTFRDILPYSVIVHNGSAQALVGLCVRFEVEDPNGRVLVYSHSFDKLPPLKADILAPGCDKLVAIDRSYSDASVLLNRKRDIVSSFRLPDASYTSARNIAVQLDSCLLRDGTFLGPDRSNTFARYSRTLNARRDLANKVLRYKGQDLSLLEQFLKAERDAVVPPRRSLFDGDFCAEARHDQARNWLYVVSTRGPDVLFKMCEDTLISTMALQLHR